MLGESSQSLLLLKMELLCFQPVPLRHLFHACLRIVAKTSTGIGEIISESLSLSAEHVQNCSPAQSGRLSEAVPLPTASLR
jgi:hypothetical protein